ncbi:carbohydrate ABC transporter permease [Bacillus salipaludis]|uniref:Carbohydrate ABC transporter permease n=1 Tax=Bacillus salipaludis TaxID=2547811 RepID=A0ABW8RJX5_9BACI
MKKQRRAQFLFIAAFIIPTIIIFGVFTLYPLINGLYLSFFDWSGYSSDKTFIGIDNYKRLFQDSIIPVTIKNDFFLVFWKVIIIASLAVFFAVALTRFKLRESGVWRVVFFLPNILSVAIIGVLWAFIFNPEFGLINGFLRMIHLEEWTRPWLGDSDWALPSLIVPSIWSGIGFYMILIIAGILNIPPDLYEAAKIDGATEWQQFIKITLPLAWEQIKLSVLHIIITTLNGSYIIVQLMTKGGPDNVTNVMGNYLYQMGFEQYQFGYGATIGVMILVISLVTIFVVGLFLKRDVTEM